MIVEDIQMSVSGLCEGSYTCAHVTPLLPQMDTDRQTDRQTHTHGELKLELTLYTF